MLLVPVPARKNRMLYLSSLDYPTTEPRSHFTAGLWGCWMRKGSTCRLSKPVGALSRALLVDSSALGVLIMLASPGAAIAGKLSTEQSTGTREHHHSFPCRKGRIPAWRSLAIFVQSIWKQGQRAAVIYGDIRPSVFNSCEAQNDGDAPLRRATELL